MNEIKKCSVAGISFTMEKDAYQTLTEYLDSLRKTYNDTEEGNEIIADIEARIAELILSAIQVDAIVTKPLISNIIKQLGSASEIDEEAAERAAHAQTTDINGNPRIPRRLYRDLRNGKLGGVCAGVANYFDTDPAWIRLAVFSPLLIMILGNLPFLHWIAPSMGQLFGVVILGYIIMWFVVPPASSARQQLEMKGERVTAQNISNTVQQGFAEPNRSLLAQILGLIGRILLIILKIIAVFILIGLVVGAGILCVTAMASLPLFTLNFITGLAVAGFFLVIILPIFVLIYLAIMLILSLRPNGKSLLIIFIIWLIALVTMTIAAIKSDVHFDRQIENVFESVFTKNDNILYEEFSDEEVAAFRQKIGADVNLDVDGKKERNSMEGVDSYNSHYKVGSRMISINYDKERLVIFYGKEKDIEQIKKSLRFETDKILLTSLKGENIAISNDCNITANGNRHISRTEDDGNKSIYFKCDDVHVRVTCGPNIDVYDIAEEDVDEMFGIFGPIFETILEVQDETGELLKEASKIVGQNNSATKQHNRALKQHNKAVERHNKAVKKSLEQIEMQQLALETIYDQCDNLLAHGPKHDDFSNEFIAKIQNQLNSWIESLVRQQMILQFQ